ncbi:MAG TPA: HD domain-containing protein [bacterium]|nr:HD domain-containing protein [bacterium]HPV65187.1 HD domain-containing protein [bacterium]
MFEKSIEILRKIEENGFEAYLVGGCVRDLLMAKEPKDFDITTNALPDDVLKIFDDARYENDFGTVLLPIRDENGKAISVIEITTYRSESGYQDHRRPDEVIFEKELDKDLSRRDFTVNAMALCLPGKNKEKYNSKKIEINKQEFYLVDFFGGLKDIKLKIIRAVGEPLDRFKEDALRMMRAVRFSCQLDFELEPKTERAIIKMAGSIKFIAKERIKDELVKILSSNKPMEGIERLKNLKLLQYIIPEILLGEKMEQNHHHVYTVLKHSLLSLKHCPSSKWQVRLAAFLHDVGKPASMKVIDGGRTFYNHEYIGAKITRKIMDRLKFSREDTETVVNLVKNHMFYYNVGEVTAASVRRLIAKTGRENLSDLIDLRVADRLGSGTPKAMPYKLRHLQYMMEKVQNDPVSVKMLQVNGDIMISELKMEPGPKMGAILDVLLAEVLENPELNEKKVLMKRVKELDKLNLEELREKAKEVIEEKRSEDDKNIKKKFKV